MNIYAITFFWYLLTWQGICTESGALKSSNRHGMPTKVYSSVQPGTSDLGILECWFWNLARSGCCKSSNYSRLGTTPSNPTVFTLNSLPNKAKLAQTNLSISYSLPLSYYFFSNLIKFSNSQTLNLLSEDSQILDNSFQFANF